MENPVVAAVALVVAIVGGLVAGFVVRGVVAAQAVRGAQEKAGRIVAEARTQQKDLILEAKDEKLRFQREAEDEARAKRAELAALEGRLLTRDEQLDQRTDMLEQRDRKLLEKERDLDRVREGLAASRTEQIAALERVSGMTAEDAKAVIIEAVRAEAEVDALLELVRALRNARSEAKLEPAAWLAVEVALPPALEAAFDALAPALERLAHARPLARVRDAAALRSGAAGALAVVAGPIEGMIRPAASDAASAARDRARMERELAGAETQLEGARARLADERFMAQAPPVVVERARERAAEFEDRVAKLRASLAG